MRCFGACWQWIRSRVNGRNNNNDNINVIDRLYHNGDDWTVPLGEVVRGAWLSAQDILPALRAIAGAPGLTISFQYYDIITLQSEREFLQFLLQYVSSRKNIRKLTLLDAEMGEEIGEGAAFACRQFLIAAVESETIRHLCFQSVTDLRVQDLFEFCRVNRNIKVLELSCVKFDADERLAQNALTDASESHSSMVPLDKMILNDVTFTSRSASLAFADNLAPRLNIAEIELGTMKCAFRDHDKRLKRIVSSLIRSETLKRLRLQMYCPRAPCIAALVAGISTVEELYFECGQLRESEIKFCRLIKSITEMVKLKVLHIKLFCFGIDPKPKKRFFQAIDANATLTEIKIEEQGNRNISFNKEEIQWLEGRAKRNRNLRRLIENPGEFSDKEVLVLMLQLQNCPTGRLQLARALPVAFFRHAVPTNSNDAQPTRRSAKARRRIVGPCIVQEREVEQMQETSGIWISNRFV